MTWVRRHKAISAALLAVMLFVLYQFLPRMGKAALITVVVFVLLGVVLVILRTIPIGQLGGGDG